MKNPDGESSHIWVFWLRESGKNSNFFTLILPIFTHKTRYGEKIMSVDPNEVKKYLKMNDEGVVRLTRKFLYPKAALPLCKRTVLDRRAMAEQYQEMIESGFCTNQADVARQFGVSRAWVTKIMGSLKSLHSV